MLVSCFDAAIWPMVARNPTSGSPLFLYCLHDDGWRPTVSSLVVWLLGTYVFMQLFNFVSHEKIEIRPKVISSDETHFRV
jgi:hypothetical protein